MLRDLDLGSVIIDCETKHYNIGRDTERYGKLGLQTEILPYVA